MKIKPGILLYTILIACLVLTFAEPCPPKAQAGQQSVGVGRAPFDVCLNSLTDKKYVACSASNAVSVIGPQDTLIRTIPVGPMPTGIAIDESRNRIYVTNQDSSNVSVIDGTTDTVVKTIAVGKAPVGICFNPSTRKAYVMNSQDDTVSVIDGLTDAVTTTFAVGGGPVYAACNNLKNKIYVTGFDARAVFVINGATDTVEDTINLRISPFGVAVDQTSNNVYVAAPYDGTVATIDGATDEVRSQIWLGPDAEPRWVSVNDAIGSIYVTCFGSSNIAVINGADALTTCIGTGPTPSGIDADIATGRIYVAEMNAGTVSVRQDLTGQVFYFAEGTCRPDFVPYICIQNPGSKAADIRITYMLGDGTYKEQRLDVAPHSRSTVRPQDLLGCADDLGHDFSSKVECLNGQKIIAERPMYFKYGATWDGGHDLMGVAGPSMDVYFAEGTTRHGSKPYVCIQNPNDLGTCVTVAAYDKSTVGALGGKEIVVAPRSRTTVLCSDFVEADNDFFLEVKSRAKDGLAQQPIIVERPMYFNYNSAWAGGSDTAGRGAPSTVYYFAEGTTRPGFDTFICLAAPELSAQVKVTLMMGDGATKTMYFTLTGRTTINCKDIIGTADDAAHDFSARVESTSGDVLVVERPMYFNYGGAWTGGHDVAGASSPSRLFYFAEGSTRPNFETYFCVQNPGNSLAVVKITYMTGNGTVQEQELNVSAHSRSTVTCRALLGSADDAAHDFSAKVECTNGQDIVVERPMYFNYGGRWTGGHDVVGYQE